MADPFLGEIRMFAGNFAPLGWAFCDGSLMAISQNDALFALLGTTYGGDGQNTFGLPDLRGRVPVHQGQSSGTSNYVPGEALGVETVTLTTGQLPGHSHVPACSNAAGSAKPPASNYWANWTGTQYSSQAPNAQMNPLAVVVAGNSAAHDNMLPFLVVNFIIALQGVFPSQN